MYEILYELSPYAPVVVFVATTLDIVFLTGYLLYGGAMMASVLMMYTSGMISAPMIVLSAYAGTMLGNIINFYAGRFFGETKLVQKRLDHPKVEKARDFLRTKGLFLFMFVGRFVTFTRPLYALVLGTLDIRFRRFILYEATIALFWICFWLYVILEGGALIIEAVT